MGFILILILFAIIYISTLATYSSLVAAGVDKTKALIPFINTMEWVRIIGRPKYQAFVVYIPIFNFFLLFSFFTDLSRCFGKTSFMDYFQAMVLPILHFQKISKEAKYLGTINDLPAEAKSTIREWSDSILFAVLAATLIRWSTFEAFMIPTQSMEGTLLVGDYLFVSKLHYGPRSPITPLQVPLTHQNLWFTGNPDGTGGTKSYSDLIQLPYFRFPGFKEIERNDIVVFNWPWDNGKDESWVQIPENRIWKRKDNTEVRPKDLKTNYVKRCVAIAGDTLQIKNQQLYVNGKESNFDGVIQHSYTLQVDSVTLYNNIFKQLENLNGEEWKNKFQILSTSFEADFATKFNLYCGDVKINSRNSMIIHTSDAKLEEIKKVSFVKNVSPNIHPLGQASSKALYPYEKSWSLDFYGPLVIPKKGMTIKITQGNIHSFQHALNYFEGDDVRLSGDFKNLLVDGKRVETYTFRQNYYYMVGDNRHNSLDSRTWGFVPEDHVVGTPMLVWLSIESNPKKSLFERIRWSRIFKWVM